MQKILQLAKYIEKGRSLCKVSHHFNYSFFKMQEDLTIIIGAGPSGLAAAKYAKQEKLNFIVFERFPDIGGVWNPVNGLVWKRMHTNISRHCCRYTDFEWPFQPQIFPTNQEFFRYLKAYAEHFELLPHITFNAEVKSLSKKPNEDLYEITVDVNGQAKHYTVPHVIIASGLFSTEYIPNDIKGINDFKGRIIHSKDYKQSTAYEGTRVLVVGGSFTAIELASDLSNQTQVLINSFRSPFFVRPHFIRIQQKTELPRDLVFYKRKENQKINFIMNQQQIMEKNKMILAACGEQQQIPSLKIHPQDMKKPLCNNISSGYVRNVKQGKIVPRRSTIKEFKDNSVVLNTEQGPEQLEIDAVIFCTGYHTSLSYFSNQIQNIIKCNPWVQRHPTVMYKSVLHPDLKGLHFCGLFRGVLIPICEMQAKFAVYMIVGKGTYPTEQQLKEDLEIENKYHGLQIIPQGRYPNYAVYCDQLAAHLGYEFDLQALKKENPQKYQKFMSLPIIQQKNNLTTVGIDQQIQNIEKALKDSTVRL